MWNPSSWTKYSSKQLPNYNNANAAVTVKNKLHSLLPLINYKNVENLKTALTLASNGKAFVLQMGECAESFKNSSDKNFTTSFYNFFTTIVSLLQQQLKLPIVKIGRIAGQFAKPRSNLLEDCGTIAAFRGEIINGTTLNSKVREANPYRMLLAYCVAKKTLQYLASCQHNEQLVNDKQTNIVTNNVFNRISKNNEELTIDTHLYTSHEALLLPYEVALTRKIVPSGYYNLSAHMVWLGARTGKLPSPHVEYLRGILNPIGIKVHNNMSAEELVQLITLLNPSNKQGKIIAIVRLNSRDMEKLLPLYLKTLQQHRLNVLFMCDPMHANTKKVGNYKVRHIKDIIANIASFINICKNNRVIPAGLHLEATFMPVTECVGGAVNEVTGDNLSDNYLTTCDPRLNYQQTLEIVQQTIDFLKD